MAIEDLKERILDRKVPMERTPGPQRTAAERITAHIVMKLLQNWSHVTETFLEALSGEQPAIDQCVPCLVTSNGCSSVGGEKNCDVLVKLFESFFRGSHPRDHQAGVVIPNQPDREPEQTPPFVAVERPRQAPFGRAYFRRAGKLYVCLNPRHH